MRLPVNYFLPLAALVLLNGCVFGGGQRSSAPLPVANSPSADYPVVIGAPFTIDGVTYTPIDRLNYDEVGHAAVAPQQGQGITASHKVLPLPSYAEVTSLENGRTILVRLENRGPMTNDLLIELSPQAAVQLGFGDGERTPIRVRRVNPPEQERALLRAGKQAPLRMDTPKPLLKVLSRKLTENGSLAVMTPALKASKSASLVKGPAALFPALAQTPKASAPPAPASKPVPKPGKGDLVVQVAAFSSQARADGAATKLGANVTKPGKYWYVRLGPYASQADASDGLAKARAAGYSDARIQKAD